MTRAPQWTLEEFEKLLLSPTASGIDLAQLLPGRSADAIKVVQQGIHSYHLGRDASMLSELMRDRLADSRRPAKCPLCGHDVIEK